MFLAKIALQIIGAWLLADWMAGLFHWFEDRYLDENQSSQFWHILAAENALHHRKPTAMCMVSRWENIRHTAAVSWPIASVLCLMGAPIWTWLTFVFVAFGNLIHRFSHEPKRKLPKLIRALQYCGLLISHEQHFKHHYWDDGERVDPKWNASRAYCPMTSWLNPVLDYLGFWWVLESTIQKSLGICPIHHRH